MNIFRSIVSAFGGAVICLAQPAMAETMSSPLPAYQGGIKLVETTPYLKKVRNQIKQIERAAGRIDDETNIQMVPIQMHGDLIGAEKIVSVEFLNSAVNAVPRKDVVDKEMNELSSVIHDVSADEEAFGIGAQQLDLPLSVEAKLKSIGDLWNASMNSMLQEFKNLQTATQCSLQNQNDAISTSAKKVREDCAALEHDLHKAERIIHEQRSKFGQ